MPEPNEIGPGCVPKPQKRRHATTGCACVWHVCRDVASENAPWTPLPSRTSVDVDDAADAGAEEGAAPGPAAAAATPAASAKKTAGGKGQQKSKISLAAQVGPGSE